MKFLRRLIRVFGPLGPYEPVRKPGYRGHVPPRPLPPPAPPRVDGGS